LRLTAFCLLTAEIDKPILNRQPTTDNQQPKTRSTGDRFFLKINNLRPPFLKLLIRLDRRIKTPKLLILIDRPRGGGTPSEIEIPERNSFFARVGLSLCRWLLVGVSHFAHRKLAFVLRLR